jgi:hypothetical protein
MPTTEFSQARDQEVGGNDEWLLRSVHRISHDENEGAIGINQLSTCCERTEHVISISIDHLMSRT